MGDGGQNVSGIVLGSITMNMETRDGGLFILFCRLTIKLHF